jgi:hypothetical protein
MPVFHGYQRVERALCDAFEIPTKRRGKLAARIKHLQRVGLKAAERVAGGPAEYEQEGIDRWLVALALMRDHIDPHVAARTVLEQWRWPEGDTKSRGKCLAEIVQMARESPYDDERGIFLYLQVDDLLLNPEPTVGVGWICPVSDRMQENWKTLFSPGPEGRDLLPLSYYLHRLDKALITPQENLP